MLDWRIIRLKDRDFYARGVTDIEAVKVIAIIP
jgi:hypothetical protein